MARRSIRRTRPRTIRSKTVKVKAHTRSPRGPNRGKKAQHVRGYTRAPSRG